MPRATLCLLVLAVSSCGEPGPQTPGARGFDLIGVWRLDLERSLAEVDARPEDEAEKAMEREFLNSPEAGAIELVFARGGKTEVRNRPGTDGPRPGTWTIVSQEDDVWVVDLAEDGVPDSKRARLVWLGPDLLRAVDEEKGDALVLRRR
jgi:hypothetical protein